MLELRVWTIGLPVPWRPEAAGRRQEVHTFPMIRYKDRYLPKYPTPYVNSLKQAAHQGT
jgi:hypothetical protein